MCSFSEKERDIRDMFRELQADIREVKADTQELKAYIQRLIGSSSAECNVNARSLLDHQIKKSEVVEFQLLFANKLPDKIFTRDKIRDERDESIQIKLIDTISRETVELDPLSSTEIKIEVLDGAFGSEGNENWTEQEFNAKIVRERKGEGSLVKGKQEITLRKGVGIIDDLSFLDNSSWNACGKFRLGARVLQRSSMGQARIKEAISQAFAVRDYRGKRSQKLDLPSLDNDVSPLKKGKKKAKCHTDNNIHTVRDFKQMHRTDLNKEIEEVSCIVDDEKLNAVQFIHKGMQNANNHASSSHGHKGGFSTAEEIVPNLASQPLATPTNGVSGQDSSQSNYNPPMTESSQINNGQHSHIPAEEHVFNAFDDTRPNAFSNLLISQAEAEACNSPTTGPLPHEYPAPYQGFTGMQNANNHASSSHDHSGGFSTAEEIIPNLASQPLDTSTDYPVNAQGVQSNSNGFSGWNSSQSNYNPPMTKYSQTNNGLHSHFLAEQHVFNAFYDTRPNAHSNTLISQEEAKVYDNRTAGPLPLQNTVSNQGLAGMQNDCNPASSQYMSEPWREIVFLNNVCDPEWNLSPLNEISNFTSSKNSFSQNDNGLLEQNMVDTPNVQFWDKKGKV